MGTLIERACRQKHHVVLYLNEQSSEGEKSHQQIQAKHLADFVAIGAEIHSIQGKNLGKQRGLDLLFVLEGLHTLVPDLGNIKNLRIAGTQVLSLPNFFEVAHHSVAALDAFDLTIYLSDYARRAHFDIANAAELLPTYEAKSFTG